MHLNPFEQPHQQVLPMLIDSHCHLDVPAFDSDRDTVLKQAHAAGVRVIVLPAIEAATWPRISALCAQPNALDTPHLYAAYGLHPMFVHQHQPAHLQQLKTMLAQHPAVAIGECGLDFFSPNADKDTQLVYFRAQLHLAKTLDLPVIVHARRAVDAVIAQIRRIGNLRGVVHSFSGSYQQARQLQDLGFLLGFGGPLTYPRAQRLRHLITQLDSDQLLFESDAPDQPDSGIAGQRNHPARLAVIVQEAARLRGQSMQELAHISSANARRLFAL